ncbi:S16 family serine protease [Peribacillus sp. NPDC096622]|uniref:S16 family serine protease n=1 Tax=Peribacillus sp. NPDC096622 TaxID=3364396 RepID=UPI0038022A07
MNYSQGWLVGQDGTQGYLVPFEVCVRLNGTYQITWSGPVSQDMIQSFSLCSWAVQLLLEKKGKIFKSFDCHFHFPLHRINGSGVSCRLAIAYSLLEAFGNKLLLPATEVALTGDLNLYGEILPVEGVSQKINVVQEAGFKHLFVSNLQPETSNLLFKIHHIEELIGREI